MFISLKPVIRIEPLFYEEKLTFDVVFTHGCLICSPGSPSFSLPLFFIRIGQHYLGQEGC